MTATATDFALQDRLLPGVSRTFALTIPQLPEPLRVAVTNAYLLCRIADTIEDDDRLQPVSKQRFHEDLIAALNGDLDPAELAVRLTAAVSRRTPAPERLLIAEMAGVIRVTHALPAVRRNALLRCVGIMCRWMPRFERAASSRGLATLRDLESYCYVVAGAVGEMLTELFCDHSATIAARGERLMTLARPFGQALQLTNILKDFREDAERGTCWIPQELFERHGLGEEEVQSQIAAPRFQPVMAELIGIAHACLRDSARYVRALPRRETGIRRFCLWAIGLSVLTLRNLHRQPGYRSGSEVKVSRRAVRATLLTCRLLGPSNAALSLAFKAATAGLPLDRSYGMADELPEELMRDTVTNSKSG